MLLRTAVALLSVASGWAPIQDPFKPRHKPKPKPMRTGLASWYALHGTGACGVGDVQGGYRFASLFLRCGTRIRICHGSRCVVAAMSDHGPYVGGRTFDLNRNLRGVLACSDLCWVRWRLA